MITHLDNRRPWQTARTPERPLLRHLGRRYRASDALNWWYRHSPVRYSLQTPRRAQLTTGSQSVPQAHEDIAREMVQDIILCSLNDWFSAYQPFELTSDETSGCVRALEVNPDEQEGTQQKKQRVAC